MNDYTLMREAARRAILASNCFPVLIEDFPSLNQSSRNSCLDALRSCDLLLLIIGGRGGWTTPSGELVVEEEFNYARKNQIPVRVFVEDVEHDEDATRFISMVSDYVDGFYRKTFQTPAELEHSIKQTLKGGLDSIMPEVDPRVVVAEMNKPKLISSETAIRIVVSAIRPDPLLDQLSLCKGTTAETISNLAQKCKVFNFCKAKRIGSSLERLQITEIDNSSYSDEISAAVTVVNPATIVLEARASGVTGSRRSFDLSRIYEVLVSEIEFQLRNIICTIVAILNELDPYKRFDSFYYNATLLELGTRHIVDERTPAGTGITLNMHSQNFVNAFTDPMKITRDALYQVEENVRLISAYLRERSRQQ